MRRTKTIKELRGFRSTGPCRGSSFAFGASRSRAFWSVSAWFAFEVGCERTSKGPWLFHNLTKTEFHSLSSLGFNFLGNSEAVARILDLLGQAAEFIKQKDRHLEAGQAAGFIEKKSWKLRGQRLAGCHPAWSPETWGEKKNKKTECPSAGGGGARCKFVSLSSICL